MSTSAHHRRPTVRRPLALGLALPLVLAGCGTAPSGTGAPAETPAEEPTAAQAAEVATATPRLVITHDSGLLVVDATTLETVEDLPVEGYTRISAAGDGRHVVVTTQGGFQVLDAGVWAEGHGDHDHYYAGDPEMTGTTFEAEEPGHVVSHAGRTVLFDDGTGAVTAFDADAVAEGGHDLRELTTPSAHHGVAVELTDGTMVVSEGTDDGGTGIRVLDARGNETAASDQCPGVHGEAVAADEVVVVGCEDGALVVRDGAISKVTAPDPYGRIGNQAGSEVSPIVLGDYKVDPDAERERPTRVSLIDTRDASLRLVDLPASYTFQSLARGDAGEALVLGTDGQLHVIDPASGALTRSVPVIDAWTEPDDWQAPRPVLEVHDGTAHVTDPATRSVHAVDVETGEVYASGQLDVVPNELTVVSGDVSGHTGADTEHEGGGA